MEYKHNLLLKCVTTIFGTNVFLDTLNIDFFFVFFLVIMKCERKLFTLLLTIY